MPADKQISKAAQAYFEAIDARVRQIPATLAIPQEWMQKGKCLAIESIRSFCFETGTAYPNVDDLVKRIEKDFDDNVRLFS